MGLVAGLVAFIAGVFLLFVEVKDPIQVIAIALAVMGLALLFEYGRGLLPR